MSENKDIRYIINEFKQSLIDLSNKNSELDSRLKTICLDAANFGNNGVNIYFDKHSTKNLTHTFKSDLKKECRNMVYNL